MVEDTQSQPTPVADSKPGTDESTNVNAESFEPQKSAEEYAKLWRQAGQEAKKTRQALAQVKKELEDEKRRVESVEAETMKAKGDHESAWKKEKMMREAIETEYKSFKAKSAFQAVSSQFEREAMKRGCVDPKALTTLASAHGVLEDLMVDDDLSVSPDSLKTAIERAEKDWTYLFSKRAPQFRDGVPATSSTVTNKQPEYSKMKSADEIIAWARANQNKLS